MWEAVREAQIQCAEKNMKRQLFATRLLLHSGDVHRASCAHAANGRSGAIVPRTPLQLHNATYSFGRPRICASLAIRLANAATGEAQLRLESVLVMLLQAYQCPMNSISTWIHGVGVLSQVAVFVCYNGILLDTALLPSAVRLAWSRASPLHLQQNDAASPKKTHKRSKRSKPLAATSYSTSGTNKWHLTRALITVVAHVLHPRTGPCKGSDCAAQPTLFWPNMLPVRGASSKAASRAISRRRAKRIQPPRATLPVSISWSVDTRGECGPIVS